MDGSDGKQARRTKSGSPLGELVDHGADALMTTFIATIMADCIGTGIDSAMFWALRTIQLFYNL